MDIAMPQLNGLEAARQMIKAVPATKVLMLSAHSDHAYVENAIESGARGFLLKHTSAHDVCRAIREVQKGNTFFSPSIARRLDRLDPQTPDRTGRLNKKVPQLTSREMEGLQLVAEGRANKETAAALGIGTKTVEFHRSEVRRILHLRTSAALVRYAIDHGILE